MHATKETQRAIRLTLTIDVLVIMFSYDYIAGDDFPWKFLIPLWLIQFILPVIVERKLPSTPGVVR